MQDIVYKCLNEKCNTIFHEVNKDGIRCPICSDLIVPIGEFKDYCLTDIPSYKYLKKTKLVDEQQMVTEKSIKEFTDAGMLWLINHFLHLFGWALVVESDDAGVAKRMFPARVKFRGFSETNNTEGYIKVSKFMKEHADQLLSESEQ